MQYNFYTTQEIKKKNLHKKKATQQALIVKHCPRINRQLHQKAVFQIFKLHQDFFQICALLKPMQPKLYSVNRGEWIFGKCLWFYFCHYQKPFKVLFSSKTSCISSLLMVDVPVPQSRVQIVKLQKVQFNSK